MTEKPLNDPILTRFRAAVTEIYGDRVERVVLFVSVSKLLDSIESVVIPITAA